MITIATLKDGLVAGQRRAQGRKIRKILVICIDNYNILMAEGSDPANPVGRKFAGNLVQLSRCMEQMGLNTAEIEEARLLVIDFFKRFSGEAVGDLSWTEMDQNFKVSQRRDDSSGILVLYDNLKKKGWTEDEVEEVREVA